MVATHLQQISVNLSYFLTLPYILGNEELHMLYHVDDSFARLARVSCDRFQHFWQNKGGRINILWVQCHEQDLQFFWKRARSSSHVHVHNLLLSKPIKTRAASELLMIGQKYQGTFLNDIEEAYLEDHSFALHENPFQVYQIEISRAQTKPFDYWIKEIRSRWKRYYGSLAIRC